MKNSAKISNGVKKNQKFEGYVIGVDGGATKTVVVLADLEGKTLKVAKSGPSSPRNVGIKTAAENITEAIGKVLKKEKILSTFIGLPAVGEEPWRGESVKVELLKFKKISRIFKGKVKIDSDQIVAYRSGTDEKDGVLLIAGTGSVARGWRGQREVRASGWGWLTNEGAAFFIGQKTLEAISKDLDGRGPKTSITKIAFKELKIENEEDLLLKVYSQNPTIIIPRFSIFCDKASQQGDLIAKRILIEAGEELVLSANTVIKKLNFQRKKFPLVLVGSVFKSKIILDKVKKEIKKLASGAVFIQPKQEPVTGAVKLALEAI